MPTQADTDWEAHEYPDYLYLDSVYENITPGSYTLVRKPVGPDIITSVKSVETLPRTEYGLSAKSSRLKLDKKWFDKITMDILRTTTVFAQSEPLELAEEPYQDSPGHLMDVSGNAIELDGLYDGLQPGRWIIVSGERADIPGTTGIRASELVMVASVEQKFDENLPGDTVHTVLHLASSPDGRQHGLAYSYKRDSVIIHANVVKATHGETRTEVLGSGDAGRAFQEFSLRQSPLTFVAAPTRIGTESTLQVRVNDILWHEAESFAPLGPNDRDYVSRIDDDGKTTVTFGNGRSGARIPTGVENVRAAYRTGIGKPGNVAAGRISLLATKPLGVKGVVNPIRASGGADRETRDQARRTTPLVTMSLDRLVSVEDYASFALTFAGIGKASARKISDGLRELVHLTIAGMDDIPIDKSSDLYQNLVQALHRFGDPYQPVEVALREQLLITLSVRVRIRSDYQWNLVEPRIRQALYDALGFDCRDLGQNVYLSEIIGVVQGVDGVEYVEIELFNAYRQADVLAILPGQDKIGRQLQREQPGKPPAFITVEQAKPGADPGSGIAPAQIAYLSPDVPDTLILKELTA